MFCYVFVLVLLLILFCFGIVAAAASSATARICVELPAAIAPTENAAEILLEWPYELENTFIAAVRTFALDPADVLLPFELPSATLDWSNLTVKQSMGQVPIAKMAEKCAADVGFGGAPLLEWHDFAPAAWQREQRLLRVSLRRRCSSGTACAAEGVSVTGAPQRAVRVLLELVQWRGVQVARRNLRLGLVGGVHVLTPLLAADDSALAGAHALLASAEHAGSIFNGDDVTLVWRTSNVSALEMRHLAHSTSIPFSPVVLSLQLLQFAEASPPVYSSFVGSGTHTYSPFDQNTLIQVGTLAPNVVTLQNAPALGRFAAYLCSSSSWSRQNNSTVVNADQWTSLDSNTQYKCGTLERYLTAIQFPPNIIFSHLSTLQFFTNQIYSNRDCFSVDPLFQERFLGERNFDEFAIEQRLFFMDAGWTANVPLMSTEKFEWDMQMQSNLLSELLIIPRAYWNKNDNQICVVAWRANAGVRFQASLLVVVLPNQDHQSESTTNNSNTETEPTTMIIRTDVNEATTATMRPTSMTSMPIDEASENDTSEDDSATNRGVLPTPFAPGKTSDENESSVTHRDEATLIGAVVGAVAFACCIAAILVVFFVMRRGGRNAAIQQDSELSLAIASDGSPIYGNTSFANVQ